MRKTMALALLAGLVSYGCGDDSSILCGSGTVEQDGECVVTGDACAAGTMFDTATGTCVPTSTDPCGAGTHLDQGTGTCVPDVVCAMDEVAHNGVCLSQDEIDADMADVVEGDPDDNDPSFGGTAESLTLPAVGDSTIFTGQIGTPADLDNDMQVDQDWDVYSFDAAAGDAVKVLIKSLGAASMGYRVWGPNGYVRYSPLYFEAQPQRYLLLPYAGTYYIGVAPQLRVDELDQTVNAAPEGGSEYGYVGTLERVASFTATDLVAGTPATGNFKDLTNNLYLVKAAAGDLVRAELLDPIGADVEPIFITLDASGAPTGELTDLDLLHIAAAADDLHVLIDYVRMTGPSDDYTFSATKIVPTDLGTVPADGSITAQPSPAVTVPADSAGYLSITVSSEQVVEIDVDMGSFSVSSPDVRVLAADGSVVLEAADDGSDLRFYTQTGGTYVVEVFNDDAEGDEGSVTVDVSSTTVEDLGSFDSTTNSTASSTAAPLTAQTNAYFKIEGGENVRVAVDVTQSTSVDLDGYVYTTAFSLVDSDASSGNNPSISFVPLASGDVRLIRVYNYSSVTDAADVVVTVTATPEPTAEAEPNDSAATAQALSGPEGILGQADSSDLDYYKLTPTATGLYRITATDLDGSTDLVITLENASGDLLESNNQTSSPYVGAVLQAGVEYVVLVENDFGTADYLLSFEEVTVTGQLESEPNDTSSNTPVTVASTPDALAGSLTSTTDEDWFKVTMASGADVAISLGSLDLAGDSLIPNGGVTLQVFASDGTTEITGSNGVYTLATGDSFVKVTGYNSAGGNSYAVSLTDPPQSYTSSPNLPLDSTNTTQVDAISVPDTCVIASVSIDVNISHAYRGDLRLTLQSAAGTSRVLQTESFTGGLDLIGNYPGTLTPTDSLSALAGEQAQGTWTLTVEDTYPSLDDGTWNSWGVNIVCQ